MLYWAVSVYSSSLGWFVLLSGFKCLKEIRTQLIRTNQPALMTADHHTFGLTSVCPKVMWGSGSSYTSCMLAHTLRGCVKSLCEFVQFPVTSQGWKWTKYINEIPNPTTTDKTVLIWTTHTCLWAFSGPITELSSAIGHCFWSKYILFCFFFVFCVFV